MRDRRIDRELLAVAPNPGYDALRSHAARRRAGLPEAADVIAVGAAEALGNEPRQWRANGFFLGTAKHPFRCDIEQYDVLTLVDGDDRVHRRVEDSAQTRFTTREQRFGAHALGDVAQDHGEQLLAVFRVLGDRGFDGKLLAVGAQRHQDHLAAHTPRCHAGLAEGFDVGAMFRAKPLRDELVQWLTEHRRTRPQKGFFRRGIEQNHALTLIHCNHRIHRRLDDIADARLDVLQRSARRLASPDLTVKQQDGQEQRDDDDCGRGGEHLRAIGVQKQGRQDESPGRSQKGNDGRENDQHATADMVDADVLSPAGHRASALGTRWKHSAFDPSDNSWPARFTSQSGNFARACADEGSL